VTFYFGKEFISAVTIIITLGAATFGDGSSAGFVLATLFALLQYLIQKHLLTM
jgi:hypothetical protein